MYGNQHTSKSISSKKRIKSNIKAENKNSGYKRYVIITNKRINEYVQIKVKTWVFSKIIFYR